jgi:hypothetical protein
VNLESALPVLTTILACAFAMIKGDTPERYGATMMFVAWVCGVTILLQKQGAVITTNLLFAVDIVVFLVFCVLANGYRRGWIIVVALAQALEIVIHIAREIGMRIDNLTYIYTLSIAGYVEILALAAGTFIAWRERDALASFGIVAHPDDANSPDRAASISASVFSTPKIATKDPNRGPWF